MLKPSMIVTALGVDDQHLMSSVPIYILLRSHYREPFIVLDALEEFSVTAGLLSAIFELQRKHNLSFFATSRYIPEIMTVSEGYPAIVIRARETDVQIYVQSQLPQLPAYVSRSAVFQQDIIEQIVKAGDGMFAINP
ncbi:hypothetical protein BBP40_000936 [Aspergillus hancockii]|nr:hypothetical protein BBP40_000936 [Aspergillus hancockii]